MATPENKKDEKAETKKEEVVLHRATEVAGSKILTALANIMAEVGTVKKAGYNEFHKYNYASAADVAHAIQKITAKHGLLIFQNQKEIAYDFDNTLLKITYTFTLAHVSGEVYGQTFEFTGCATNKNSKGGIDDKAINKCFTAAGKYFLIGLFKIPTGEYDDADADEDKGEGAPAPRRNRQAASPVAEEKPVEQVAAPVDPTTGTSTPHAIKVPLKDGKGDPVGWASLFIAAVKAAPQSGDVESWVNLNAKLIGDLSRYAPAAHREITSTLDARRAELTQPEEPKAE